MHKKPASRFITSGKVSSLSDLSVKVGRFLKTLLNCSKNYSTFDSKSKKNPKNLFYHRQ